ncbi:MAG: hypothetical protein LC714_02645 [Actinobacteria bacterium]|nr:hypothetical protein [Actinomycetota bacterium]
MEVGVSTSRSGEPDLGGSSGGKGAEDDGLDAEAPELAGDDGGVGHALAGLDVGQEGGGARCRGQVASEPRARAWAKAGAVMLWPGPTPVSLEKISGRWMCSSWRSRPARRR